MNSLEKEEYRKTFDNCVQCMHLRMDNDGNYFEHLMTSKLEKNNENSNKIIHVKK